MAELMNVEQKYVRESKHYYNGNISLLGPDGIPSYIASQCSGRSGLEKDLADGWLVRYLFQDRDYYVFLLERTK